MSKDWNMSHGTASLDRIDSSKGYIEGNVQWVHKYVNVMKWDFSMEEFLDICRKICITNPANEEQRTLDGNSKKDVTNSG